LKLTFFSHCLLLLVAVVVVVGLCLCSFRRLDDDEPHKYFYNQTSKSVKEFEDTMSLFRMFSRNGMILFRPSFVARGNTLHKSNCAKNKSQRTSS